MKLDVQHSNWQTHSIGVWTSNYIVECINNCNSDLAALKQWSSERLAQPNELLKLGSLVNVLTTIVCIKHLDGYKQKTVHVQNARKPEFTFRNLCRESQVVCKNILIIGCGRIDQFWEQNETCYDLYIHITIKYLHQIPSHHCHHHHR